MQLSLVTCSGFVVECTIAFFRSHGSADEHSAKRVWFGFNEGKVFGSAYRANEIRKSSK